MNWRRATTGSRRFLAALCNFIQRPQNNAGLLALGVADPAGIVTVLPSEPDVGGGFSERARDATGRRLSRLPEDESIENIGAESRALGRTLLNAGFNAGASAPVLVFLLQPATAAAFAQRAARSCAPIDRGASGDLAATAT